MPIFEKTECNSTDLMAIKFQYNKTSLQQIEKNLKMRQRTLPIIKSKETALRLEVKRCKEEADELERQLQSQIAGYERMYALWGEFDASLVSLKDVKLSVKKFAGIRVPVLDNIELEVRPFGLFSAPKWYFDGINLLQGLAKTAVEREFVFAKLHLLEHVAEVGIHLQPSLGKGYHPEAIGSHMNLWYGLGIIALGKGTARQRWVAQHGFHFAGTGFHEKVLPA